MAILPEWLKADELINAVEELGPEVLPDTLHHKLPHIWTHEAGWHK